MDELSDIMPQLQALLGDLSGEPVPLNGGITNRNFRVSLGGREYVIRRPGKDTDLLGIDRAAERIATEAASALGIAPDAAAAVGDCLVTSFIACCPLDEGDLREGVEELAVALRRFHDCPAVLPTRFWVPHLLDDYAAIVHGRGGSLPDGYEQARRAADRISVALGTSELRPCHNDLLRGNLIRSLSDARLMIVDWEYAGMGDPLFDLGNLSVNNGFDEEMDERLLAAYLGAEPTARQRAALSLMRVMSDAREAAWGVVQQGMSTLEFDFAGYAEEHFARLRAVVAEPRFDEWIAVVTQAAGGPVA